MAAASLHYTHASPVTLKAFGPVVRILWVLLVALTIVTEVVPVPGVAPIYFYIWKCFKVVLFFASGFLTPLAFWRFNSLTLGVLLAVGCSATAESLQRFSSGHSFHWIELFAKLGLIFFGFVLALDARYERQIKLGPIRIALTGEHLPSRD